MIKRFFRLKVSIPVAAVALAAGGLFTFNALADFTPGAYLDAQTFVVQWNMARISAGVVSCAGVCRTAQAGGANPHRCLLVAANQASATACLTQLASDCTPQNAINCATGAPQ